MERDTESVPLCYTVKEAAKMARISAQQVRQMLCDGEIKGFKVGNLWRVNAKAFREFMGLDDSEDLRGRIA